MLEDNPRRGVDDDDRQYSLLDLAFSAALVAAVLTLMMWWAIRTMSCPRC